MKLRLLITWKVVTHSHCPLHLRAPPLGDDLDCGLVTQIFLSIHICSVHVLILPNNIILKSPSFVTLLIFRVMTTYANGVIVAKHIDMYYLCCYESGRGFLAAPDSQ